MIVQVGGYPPPIGGISIYIKRLKGFLDFKGIENQVWDYTHLKKKEDNVMNISFFLVPFHYALKKNIDIIHYNATGKEGKYYIGLFNRFLFKNRKKVITIHGDCKNLFNIDNRLIVRSLNSFNAIICDKYNDKDYLLKQGVTSDIYEVPSFIFPVVQNKDFEKVPQRIWDFIDNHEPVIVANASNIVFYKGEDLYGLDMCIDLCINLKKEFPDIGFVFSIPLDYSSGTKIFKFGILQKSVSHIGDYNYFKKMKQKITDNDIEDNFLFNTKSCPLYPIIMKSDVFVRPTNTDGAAVSVHEALYLKTPAVASDVVWRPEGTVLFENRNIEDFTSKIKEVINNYGMYKKKLEKINMENNCERILKIYKEL